MAKAAATAKSAGERVPRKGNQTHGGGPAKGTPKKERTDKFWRIRIFCDNRHSRRGQFRALVTTNASNVGIDKHSISLQVRLEWSRDLLAYFQERGRGSRSQGVTSTCI